MDTEKEEKIRKKNTMTRECIFTALLILMEQKPYEEITITDIARKAGVSRMSYYRLYRSKDDILVQYFNEIFEGLLQEIKGLGEIDKYQFALRIFRVAGQNPRLLNAVMSAKLYELVLECFVRYCTYLAKYIFDQEVDDIHLGYWIYEEAGRFSLLLIRWLEREMKETPEEMARFLTEELKI